MKTSSPLAQLAAQFALLSLLSFGGMNVVLPDAHRFLVDVHHWLTDQQFADYYAIAQAAPGPNFLMFALFGWHVAGLIGAVVAALAVALPSGALAYVVGGLWQRFRDRPWRRCVQAGLAPITVGLVFSTGYVLSRAADHSLVTLGITAGTLVITLATNINPLWLFLVAGLLGALGLT